jgi:hypothetical protein
MKWVTRERPKIDRITWPWLITRFIDKGPEFLYGPPSAGLYAWCRRGQNADHRWPPRM